MKNGHVYDYNMQYMPKTSHFSLGVQLKEHELRHEVDTAESSLRNLGDIQQ